MKRIIFLLLCCLTPFLAYGQCGNLYIAGVIDGPLTGGTPKGVQLCATGDIADLSIYGVGSANNGGGTDGQEFTFPPDALSAGDCIWVASEAVEFLNFFGFDACYTSGAMGINGDDAVELFCSGAVEDVFGDIAVDGSGQPWEYADGWAVSSDMAASGSTFDANWTYSGINALDGATDNASAATPYPNAVSNCPIAVASGCTDVNACNYDALAVNDDGSCFSVGDVCDDGDATTTNDVYTDCATCTGTPGGVLGCMDAAACNYDATATVDDGSCFSVGDACDDGDGTTIGDVYTDCATCAGTPGGSSDVYISEISFNPCTAQGDDTACEYIVLSNATGADVDISGWTIGNGFTYTFPAGTIVPANGSLSLGISSMCAVFAFDLSGGWGGNLNNTGETVDLSDASGVLVSTITYTDATGADGDCDAQCFDVAGTASTCASSLGGGILGCIDAAACNYDATATIDDGSCFSIGDVCDDGDPLTTGDVYTDCTTCAGMTGGVPGCMDAAACNYDATATVDDGTCFSVGDACDDGDAMTAGDVYVDCTTCMGNPATSGNVYISEISFNPCTAQGDDTACEYIILTNADATAIDISDWTIGNGFTYTFPAGTMIPANGTLSLGISGMCPSFTFDLSGGWGGNLNNTGETVELSNSAGMLMSTITYTDATGADGDCDAQCFDAAGTASVCPSSLDTGGCLDVNACNYDATATTDDGSCFSVGDACDDGDPLTTGDVYVDCMTCAGTGGGVSGCTDAAACNYDAAATVDDGSCFSVGDACDDGDATTIGDVYTDCATCAGTPGGSSDVYISEISFNPCTAQGDDTLCEYIILTNSTGADVDISGWTIGNGFTYTFPAGTIVPANGSLSLGISGMCTVFAFDLSGGWGGNLNNTGETVDLSDASGALVSTITYTDATGADGDCDAQCFDVAGTASACPSSIEGVPGCMDATACNYDAAATVDDGTCYVVGDACDDGDATTTDDVYTDCMTCAGMPGAVLGCIDAAACNYDATATVDDGSCFSVGDACDDGDAMTAGDVYIDCATCMGNPATSGNVYISEISFNPCNDQGSDGDCEYIILTNADATAIDISDWTIGNGFNYTFPAGTMIPANGTLSLGVGNCASFMFDLSGGWDGNLNNTGETIELSNSAGMLMSTVTYSDALGADGDCNSQCFDDAGTASICTSSLDTTPACDSNAGNFPWTTGGKASNTNNQSDGQ